MAYQALYRKWRPATFDDVVGQEHVVTTLRNEIITGKTAHAYLFCGTRGTGKTSCAKIFARAVNCLNPQAGNPCNECEICRGVASGSILDIIEIDAASNNSVDNIRDIRDEVVYSATQAKYKIYIIDEVHMLSTGAFNALLKTLEEPPEYVIFILATTEAHKLPPTITSRCQRFDFKRISVEDIVHRLRKIADAEKVYAEQDALDTIARLADGAMRDALSILDQCISACPDGRLTMQNISAILGIAPDTLINTAVTAIAKKDAATALRAVDRLISDGRDLGNFIDMLIQRLRDIMVCKAAGGEDTDLFSYSVQNTKAIVKAAELFDLPAISYCITVLCDASAQAKWSKNARTIYELALVKLCDSRLDLSLDALAERICALEKIVASGAVTAAQKDAKEDKAALAETPPALEDDLPPWEEPPAKQQVAGSQKTSPAQDTQNQDLAGPVPKPHTKIDPPEPRAGELPKTVAPKKTSKKEKTPHTWDEVLAVLKKSSPALYGMLSAHKARLLDDSLLLADTDYLKGIIDKSRETIEDALEAVTGTKGRIVFVSETELEDLEPPGVRTKTKTAAAGRHSSAAMQNSKEKLTPAAPAESDPLDELLNIDGLNVHIEE